MYFKASEQQLSGKDLRFYLHYFQYQMRCYGCLFQFPNTKIRQNAPCVTFIWCTKYWHSTARRAWIIKNAMLQWASSNWPERNSDNFSCTASWKILDCTLAFLCSQKTLFKLSPKSDLFFCDKHGAKYFMR